MGDGTPVAVMLIVPLLPTTNAVLPEIVRTEPGKVPVVDPGASQAETSPPYGCRVAPTTVVPVGAVNGTASPEGLEIDICPFWT